MAAFAVIMALSSEVAEFSALLELMAASPAGRTLFLATGQR